MQCELAVGKVVHVSVPIVLLVVSGFAHNILFRNILNFCRLFESVAKSCMQKQPTTSSSATSTSTSTRESTTDSSQQD